MVEEYDELTIASHVGCVVSYHCSVLVRKRNQYSTGFVTLSDCFWDRMQPSCTSHASVPIVICSPKFEGVPKSDDIGARLRPYMALSTLLLSCGNVVRSVFFNRLVSGVKRLSKLGISSI